MMTGTLVAQTYMPASERELNSMERILGSGHQAAAVYALCGPDGEVPLPGAVHAILTQVVTAMQAGKAITVTPNDPMLTTQQAADLLGVTRPTLVKLLDAGRIPFERVSTRRKVRLQDVLDYRERRRQEQYDLLDAIAAPVEEEGDLSSMLEQARAARKRVASRRQAAASG